MDKLECFIVAAKAACYIGDGARAQSSRPGSHDLTYVEGDFTYRDSYFGGTDFLGQETVWCGGTPVWAMNYYGRILIPALIDAEAAGRVVKTALSALYQEGRFLGGFEAQVAGYHYVDSSDGGY